MELLGLGKSDSSDEQAPSPTILSPRSPKRRRSSPDHDPDSYDTQTEVKEVIDDDGFEQPTPKKPHRTGRTNAKIKRRDALPKEVKGRRASKESLPRKSIKTKVNAKQPGKAPRRLPVNELVMAPERYNDQDAEDKGRRTDNTAQNEC